MRRITMKRALILLITAGAVASLLVLGLVPKKHGVLGLVSTAHAQEGGSLLYYPTQGAKNAQAPRWRARMGFTALELWSLPEHLSAVSLGSPLTGREIGLTAPRRTTTARLYAEPIQASTQ